MTIIRKQTIVLGLTVFFTLLQSGAVMGLCIAAGLSVRESLPYIGLLYISGVLAGACAQLCKNTGSQADVEMQLRRLQSAIARKAPGASIG